MTIYIFHTDFEKLRRKKCKQKESKHKGEVLEFNGCISHLIEEFAELILAIKKGGKEHIAEELADLANCCEFTFVSLNKEE